MSDETRAEPKILVVDLETTDLDARAGSIVEIGAVWLTGREGEYEKRCRMWAGAIWNPESAKINGLTLAEAQDLQHADEGTVILDFMEWVGRDPVLLAGITPSFDRAFIHEALRRTLGRHLPKELMFPHRVIDLHSLVVASAMARSEPVPSRGFWTDEIYRFLDLQPEPQPHRAINGARKEAEALRLLLDLPAPGAPVPFTLPEPPCCS